MMQSFKGPEMQDCIAVINAGSSSIKFAVYEQDAALPVLFHGQIEAIGVAPHLTVKDKDGRTTVDRKWQAADLDHLAATRQILRTSGELLQGRHVAAVGHRVVHGGTEFLGPVRIDDTVLAALEKLVPLAPLHQPHNLSPIRVIAESEPHLVQVACFDTAFHRTQSPIVENYALPRALTEAGIRGYGFHGLSYEFIASRLPSVAPEIAASRVVIAHLGNGASLCAVHEGRSVATTMGFSAVDGLVMGTRCGRLDPGVLLYLMDERKMDARAISDLLYHQSGLQGVSGISSDMRTLRTSDAPEAKEAVALFVYRIVREIGSMAAALGGLDGLVFTAGIGENDAATRSAVMEGCVWLGLAPDETRNATANGRISADGSRVSAWVIPTDEERMIAQHTIETITAGDRT